MRSVVDDYDRIAVPRPLEVRGVTSHSLHAAAIVFRRVGENNIFRNLYSETQERCDWLDPRGAWLAKVTLNFFGSAPMQLVKDGNMQNPNDRKILKKNTKRNATPFKTGKARQNPKTQPHNQKKTQTD